MNKLLLKLVMLPSFLWKGFGADVAQLEAILTMRLTMDDRKPVSIRRYNDKKKEIKNSSRTAAILFALMGCVYSFPIWTIRDRVLSMSIYFSLLFLILTFTLITDYSSTLFDNRDKYILFPRPVGDRTIVLSKLLHVFIYLMRMVLPMSLAAWVSLAYFDGWKSALLFPLPLILMVCMALFIVNSFYIIVLRLASPERFKDVINYFQIFTSIVFFASVYLLPQYFRVEDGLGPANISRYHWMKYLPSSWLGSCWTWVGFHQYTGSGALYSAMGVALPIVCAFVLIRYLAPQFSKKISGIDGAEVNEGRQVASTEQAAGGKFYMKLAYLFNSSDEGVAGFVLTWLQSSRSRTFRMRVYPAFAFIPIYFIYLMIQNGGSFSYEFAHLAETSKYFLLLYMSSYILVISMNYLIMSDQYKASWVYYSSPIRVPGKVMMGALKALWVKFFLPFFITIAIFCLYIWGTHIISDIILALVNVSLLAVCMALISYRQLPFSMMEQQKQKGGRIIRSLATMFIPLMLGGGHYLAKDLWWLKSLFLILSAILLWLVWDSYANTNWDKIALEEAEI